MFNVLQLCCSRRCSCVAINRVVDYGMVAQSGATLGMCRIMAGIKVGHMPSVAR